MTWAFQPLYHYSNSNIPHMTTMRTKGQENFEKWVCMYLRWRLAVAGGVGRGRRSCIDVTLTGRVDGWGFCRWLTAHGHMSELRGEVFNLLVKRKRGSTNTHINRVWTHSSAAVQWYILWCMAVREWQGSSVEQSKRQTSTEAPERDTHMDTDIRTETMMFMCVSQCGHFVLCVCECSCYLLLLLLLLRGSALQLRLASDWLLTVRRVVHSRGSIRV